MFVDWRSIFVLANAVSATYMVTCHNQNECGSVCGSYSDDIVAPSEGIFGTSCSCQTTNSLTTKCYAFNQAISQCADNKPPRCNTACGQKICMTVGSKKSTATVLSACPRHHPENVKNCCDHPSSQDYCTCNVQDTLDAISKVYNALGGKNAYVNAVWGYCGSQLEGLGIPINSTRATTLVQPFLKNGELCQGEAAALEASKQGEAPLVPKCEAANVAGGPECSSIAGCTKCASKFSAVASQCYAKDEAAVLKHIISTEQGADMFTCEA